MQNYPVTPSCFTSTLSLPKFSNCPVRPTPEKAKLSEFGKIVLLERRPTGPTPVYTVNPRLLPIVSTHRISLHFLILSHGFDARKMKQLAVRTVFKPQGYIQFKGGRFEV